MLSQRGFHHVLQGEVSGLEVWHDNKWNLVEVIPNAFVVNVGDMCEVRELRSHASALLT